MEKRSGGISAECHAKYVALHNPRVRAIFLFLNFFFIIMALYQLKPASRSLFIGSMGADRLPYIWIGAALAMMVFIPLYHRLVARIRRFKLVLSSCMFFIVLLLLFRFLLNSPGRMVSGAFYIFVDVIGVILIEQFWSLTNTMFDTKEGKRWYGFIGAGGLIGGFIGGGAAALLLKHTFLETPDLLIVAAGILLLIFGLTYMMDRKGLYCEIDGLPGMPATMKKLDWHHLAGSRYLIYITLILLMGQLASPLIDYQFLKTVEASYAGQEARTEFLSLFFSLLGLISIGVNVGITSFIHRRFGIIAGLMVQPVLMVFSSFGFIIQTSLAWGSAAKISDRGLSYSINRASKELLYVPFDPVLIYQAKAWIDMFGYRMFKVAGSILILLFTQWTPLNIGVTGLGWFTIAICTAWIRFIMILREDYRGMCKNRV